MATPISDELRLAILRDYQKQPKNPDIIRIELGSTQGVLTFTTTAGRTDCTILEDGEFIYFNLPSGTLNTKSPKSDFLKQIKFVQLH